MTPLQHHVIAALACVAATALLWRDTESIGRLAVIMLWVVFLTLGWVIVAGLFTFSPAMAFDFPPQAFRVDADMAVRLGGAAVIAMYNYGGYNQVCNIAEEIRDPRRTVPRAIVVSILLVVALYIVMSTVIIGVIPWTEAQQTRAIASLCDTSSAGMLHRLLF
jgi:amino acid transporter